jgi:hypothetical protein
LSKEGTFRFRPTLVNNGGSIQMLRFFRALSIFFRYILRPRCRPRASSILTESGGIRGGGGVYGAAYSEAQLPQGRALAGKLGQAELP